MKLNDIAGSLSNTVILISNRISFYSLVVDTDNMTTEFAGKKTLALDYRSKFGQLQGQ